MDEIIAKHINKKNDAELFRALSVIAPRKEEWVKKQVERMREEATPSEIRVAHFLDEIGVKFISQAPFFDSEYDAVHIVDFYIPKGHFIIEVDGFSHCKAGQRGRDLVRDAFFAKEGYHIIRIANKQTESAGTMAVVLSDIIAKVALAKKNKEKVVDKKIECKKPIGERGEMLNLVVDCLEKASENDIVVFRTTFHTIALQIIDHRRGPGNLSELRWRIKELKAIKNLTVYAIFKSKKSTQWMCRHPLNPVTKEYELYSIKRPESPIIDIDKEYEKRKGA